MSTRGSAKMRGERVGPEREALDREVSPWHSLIFSSLTFLPSLSELGLNERHWAWGSNTVLICLLVSSGCWTRDLLFFSLILALNFYNKTVAENEQDKLFSIVQFHMNPKPFLFFSLPFTTDLRQELPRLTRGVSDLLSFIMPKQVKWDRNCSPVFMTPLKHINDYRLCLNLHTFMHLFWRNESARL